MMLKQINRSEAFWLADAGMEVKILVPGPEGAEWAEARTTTLSKLLAGCVFFREEPKDNPDSEAAVGEMERTAPPR